MPRQVRNRSHDLLVKIVLLGSAAVGKTCFLCRHADDDFLPNYVCTIGLDFRTKDFEVDNHRIKAQLWDTAGQERFHAITRAYYRDADGFIFIYDVTDLESFIQVKKWIKETRDSDKLGSCALVGNKIDLLESGVQRQVSKSEAQELANQYGFEYYESSAKENLNVDPVYDFVVSDIVHKSFERARSNSSISSEGSAVFELRKLQRKKRRIKCC